MEGHASSVRQPTPLPDLTANGPFTIDNFTLTKRLGAGAMGVVYLGTESLTGRTIALKLIIPRPGSEEVTIKRFLREIEVMAQLVHPNIALYAGHGVWKGQPYLAMEHINGPDLSSFLVNGNRLPEEAAMFLTIQLAEGLEYAHQRTGLVHRDVKPGNTILEMDRERGIDSTTRVKIIDFGLAQFSEIADFDDIHYGGDRTGAAKSGGLTIAKPGSVVGTPAYMPPEQVRGDADITFSADIYSLSATLYHLVTGQVPYTANSPSLVMVAHLQDPIPDPADLLPTIRTSTRDLIMRGMAKDPAKRHSSWSHYISSARNALLRIQSGPATQRYIRKAPTAPAAAPVAAGAPTTLEETGRFVRATLGDAKPGQLSGADALAQILAAKHNQHKETQAIVAPQAKPSTGVFRKNP